MNIFEILNSGQSRLNEVSFSAVFKYLMDPTESHALKDELLLRFMKLINLEGLRFDNLEIELEQRTAKGKSIDILFKFYLKETLAHLVIVENKTRKQRVNNPFDDYISFAESEEAHDSTMTVVLLIPSDLTPSGNSTFSKIQISNKYHINWDRSEDSTPSFESLLESFLADQANGDANPVSNEAIHLIKSLKYYVREYINPLRKKERLLKEVANYHKLNISGETYEFILCKNGSVKVINAKGDEVQAKAKMREYIDSTGTPHEKVYTPRTTDGGINTRSLGKSFFQWLDAGEPKNSRNAA